MASLGHTLRSLRRGVGRSRTGYRSLRGAHLALRSHYGRLRSSVDGSRRRGQSLGVRVDRLQSGVGRFGTRGGEVRRRRLEMLRRHNRCLRLCPGLIQRGRGLRRTLRILRRRGRGLSARLARTVTRTRSRLRKQEQVRVVSTYRRRDADRRKLFRTGVSVGFDQIHRTLSFTRIVFESILRM